MTREEFIKLSKEHKDTELSQDTTSSRFVNVKLNRDIVEGMVSTYEFLVWTNSGDDKKECQKILKALKKALS
jgi:hypothetical protein